MDLKERMKKSIENFIRFGSNAKTIELDQEHGAVIDDIKEEGITDFNISNITLTREVAMKITALNEGINQIADSISALPVYLYKREDDGSRQKVKDKRNKLLNLENSKHSTSYNMKKNLIMDFLFYGNGYLDINRDIKNEIISLMHIPYKEVQLIDVNSINKRELEYQYNYWGMTNEFHEVLNLVRNPYKDQLNGIGVLEEGSMALEGATGLDEYSKNVINTGFNARGVIESEKIM
ncbi:hypothetical protein AWN73_09860 [Clostridium butyricum]|uniref:Phage portal protein n=1 Tax=Clostridium butyricum TaxID=1492 RepID=A0A2S7FD98_CLOBU|nr:hypothetical protein OA81_07045 [Clostridium butyricum]PPV16565.1 hypothetical protein AWN73_09860 [Clostridium butyricum]